MCIVLINKKITSFSDRVGCNFVKLFQFKYFPSIRKLEGKNDFGTCLMHKGTEVGDEGI